MNRTHTFQHLLQCERMNMELIVAVTKNNVIGLNGKLPWHLPADLAYFKSVTNGNAILMGRKTFESIGKPLPNRKNIVITRQKDLLLEGASVVNTIQEALVASNGHRLFVIGGEEVYTLASSQIKKMHITRIDTSLEGDAYFPTFDPSDWTLVWTETRSKDEKNPFDLTFETWQRV
mgnify:CR=1 FL=1